MMPTQTTQKNGGEKTRKAEWKRVKLRELTYYCSRGISPSYVKQDGYMVLNQKCIRSNKISFDVARETSKNKKISEEKFVKQYDVLINSTGVGTLGRLAQFKEDQNNILVDSHVTILRSKKEYDGIEIHPIYFGYSLVENEAKIEQLGRGATGQTELSRDVLLDSIDVFLPEYKEQKKIAEVLSAYDDLIEVNQKKIKTLETLAQTLYKGWFASPVKALASSGKPAKDGLPDGWEVKKVGDRFTTVLGGTPSRAVDLYWQNGTVPWINSGKINEFRVFDHSELITEEALKKSATKMMPKRTTLVAITGATLGQFSLTEIECCANQSVVGIYDKENVYNEYIYLKISEIIKDLVAKSTGSAQPHINKDDVNNTEIIIPDLQTIKEFNQIILPIFDDISNLVFQNQNLQKTRDILIPQLVGGRVEVK